MCKYIYISCMYGFSEKISSDLLLFLPPPPPLLLLLFFSSPVGCLVHCPFIWCLSLKSKSTKTIFFFPPPFTSSSSSSQQPVEQWGVVEGMVQ